MTTPELSVVVPTHDVAPWIGECLRSILGQEGLGLEIVVVDDGSADGTPDVVAAIGDPRVRLVAAERPGGGPARNQGVALARGEYLAFADGDDVVPPGAYAALLASLRGSGSDMAVGNFVRFRDGEEPVAGDDGPVGPAGDRQAGRAAASPAEPVTRHVTEARTGVTVRDEPGLVRNRACWNRVFRRSFWDAQRIRFEDSRRSNDIVAMARATLAARADLVPDVVYRYRQRFGNGSMTTFGATPEAQLVYLEQERLCAPLLARAGERVRTVYSGMLLRSYLWNAVRIVLEDPGFSGAPQGDPASPGPAPGDPVEEDELRRRLAEPLAEILSLLSSDTLASLPRARRQVFTHAAAGSWNQAREALRRVVSPTGTDRALAAAERTGRRVGRAAARVLVRARRLVLTP
ncbi:glycosyltransferase family 2 protein [Myceligenerans pegani]|uniref:Glycosyltransferase family 2 protein n=1 Tax=Myceligenerans pegani TaxID=2776917 RepID=A0ABR9MZW1_9MICO|nr:glycosyltransferase family 2 protein [Myceligenerans sp. TRM 65318]MBE1876368.1 glycosyltransferase family 2 protein [Myceligenerans sp. TRM 65318]MBE3018639.1 glycosyltransferase family 2 protein [Myceligenerans sp. TRM 65318]